MQKKVKTGKKVLHKVPFFAIIVFGKSWFLAFRKRGEACLKSVIM
jgi:hypothetical protein